MRLLNSDVKIMKITRIYALHFADASKRFLFFPLKALTLRFSLLSSPRSIDVHHVFIAADSLHFMNHVFSYIDAYAIVMILEKYIYMCVR